MISKSFWVKTVLVLIGIFLFWTFLDPLMLQIGVLRVSKLNHDPSFLRGRGSFGVHVVEKLLSSGDTDTIVKGLEASRMVALPSLIPSILPFLRHNNRLVGEKALNALSSMASEDMVEPLMQLKGTGDSRTRLAILQILSTLASGQDLTKQMSRFKDDLSWVVRMTLADELGEIKGEETIQTLKDLIGDDHFSVALSAARNIAKHGEKSAFAEIFGYLEQEDNWIQQVMAIRLVTLFPRKLVSFLVARFLKSKFQFLAVSALEWMAIKGDGRDFHLIITETGNLPPNIIKATAIKVLAKLAKQVRKENEILVNLMRFLKTENEAILASALEGVRTLNGTLAADQVAVLCDSHDLRLSYQAILTLGVLGQEKYKDKLLNFLNSPHTLQREAGYQGLSYFDSIIIPHGSFPSKVPQTVREARALGYLLLFHGDFEKGANDLEKIYKSVQNVEIKVELIKFISAMRGKNLIRYMVKVLNKKDLKFWKKAGQLLEGAFVELDPYARMEGYTYYRSRQPRRSKFSLLNFSSANQSFWEQSDRLYLKGKKGEEGTLQGMILYEDYNSYYFSHSKDEVIQLGKELVDGVCYSPLSELWNTSKVLNRWNDWFHKALEREKYEAASFILQNAWVHYEILKGEIRHHPVASLALENIRSDWEKNWRRIEKTLEDKNLVSMKGRWLPRKVVNDLNLIETHPEEAKRRQALADESFKKGITLLEDGEIEAALKAFHNSLNEWALHDGALREIGVTYAKLGQYEEALKFYKQKQKTLKNDVNLLNGISLIYRLMGNDKEAQNYLEIEIASDPSKERGYLDLAELLSKKNQFDYAMDLLDGAINKVSNPKDIWFRLARMSTKIEDYSKGIKYIEDLLEVEPENVEALTYSGFLYFISGKESEAVIRLKKAIGFDLANINARLTLADVYMSMGKKKEVLIEVKKILAIDPGNEDAKALLQSVET